MSRPKRGICKQCGCTEDNACYDPSYPSHTCGWANAGQTLCTYCNDPGANARKPLPGDPEEWQEAADSAKAMLLVHDARMYGLISGGPEVDVSRCFDVLFRAENLGYKPRDLFAKQGQ